MYLRDPRHVLTKPPVLAGAAAQALALTTYLSAVAYEPPGTVMLLGLVGGSGAGLLVGRPQDGWIDGALAAPLGFLVWGVGHVGQGTYLAWSAGTDALFYHHLIFATSLGLWALPAYLVLGAVAAPIVAYPTRAARRRVRRAGS